MSTQEKPRILLVDDVPANLKVMRQVLRGIDAEIVEAGDGNEALTKFLEHDFALIILDVQMPGMDGYEVARLMREDADSTRTPIIFVTAAYDDVAHRDMGYNAGAVDYLAKPIESSILIAKVRVFLELYEARRELEEIKLDLENLVELRTSELRASLAVADRLRASAETSLERAEEADRVRTRFLSRISHELRTPLNGMLGMVQLLDDDALTEKQREFLSGIESSANTLLLTLNEVLDFTQLSRGSIDAQVGAFRLTTLLDDVSTAMSSMASEKGLQFQSERAGVPDLTLLGDVNLIRRILLALAQNAVKFTQRGTVGLRASVQPCARGQHLRVSIFDEGIGISEEKVGRIFEDFSQVDETSTRGVGGVGLGLAVARSLADALDARLSVESELQKGSMFSLDIDLQEAAAGDAGADPNAAQSQSRKRLGDELRVLIVEDNKVNQVVAHGLLRKLGIEAEMACDGQEAVEMFRPGDFDLVLMDLDMPRMDGFEATRKIRAAEAGQDGAEPVIIVALTANLESETRQRCLDVGMDDYLGKPVRLEQLRDLIEQFRAHPAREQVG